MPDTTFTRQELIGRGREPPAVNQVELHPAFPNEAVLRACARHCVGVQAYSPLGCGELLCDARVLRAAVLADGALGVGARTCTPAQALLRWALSRGGGELVVSALPRSRDAARIAENHAAARAEPLALPAEAEAELAKISGRKICWDPAGVK